MTCSRITTVDLEQRVLAAVRTGLSSRHPVSRFALNPLRYLASEVGIRLGRILFVPPGGMEVPPGNEQPPRDVEPRSSPGDAPSPGMPSARTRPPLAEEGRMLNGGFPFSIDFLQEGTAINPGADFEIVPYNDASMSRCADANFRRSVGLVAKDLLSSSDIAQSALANIASRYDSAFGKDSERRNIISLFLYMAPVPPVAEVCLYASERASVGELCVLHKHSNRSGLLYTGDGFLNRSDRFRALEVALGGPRMSNIACLQVPHHGSRRSWFPGMAGRLGSSASVFSSDLARKNPHPHHEVRSDFLRHGPLFANRSRGVSLELRYF